VIGKLASCAAMAMTVAAYVAPTAWQRPVAIGVVALLTAVTCFGVTRTARLTQALVAVTLLGLVVVLAAAGRRRPRALLRRSPSAPPTASCRPRDCSSSRSPATRASRPWARRCATPRAPFLAPSGSRSPPCSSYVLVGAAVVLTLGGAATTSAAPLVGVVDVAGWHAAAPAIRVAAAAAATGALLALLSGIGRTSLAMARSAICRPLWPRSTAVTTSRAAPS
jgi:APA family basic amino acid/polyamine antiporter